MLTNLESSGAGRYLLSRGIKTHYHEAGAGLPILLIHGSAPGTDAVSTWRTTTPQLAGKHRVIAADLVGFGLTERPDWFQGTLQHWVDHSIGMMDALQLDRADLVGHSFGGGLALALALRHPERVRRLVLIGSLGARFQITPELDAIWGYRPSLDSMRAVTSKLLYDGRSVSEEALKERYRISAEPRIDEAYAGMFPEPRQRWVNMMAGPEEVVRAMKARVLILHGRDDRVIPLSNAYRLLELMPQAEMHVFGRCGNWVQIEQAAQVGRLIGDFLGHGER